MRSVILLSLTFLLTSCSHKITREDLQQLNGYWEIEEVLFPDGNRKSFGVNPMIDYIEVSENLEGFRKKMQPKFDGTYTTSDHATFFEINEIDGAFKIEYKDVSSLRIEQLILVSETNLSLINEANVQYKYRRYHPINVGN